MGKQKSATSRRVIKPEVKAEVGLAALRDDPELVRELKKQYNLQSRQVNNYRSRIIENAHVIFEEDDEQLQMARHRIERLEQILGASYANAVSDDG